MKRTIKVKIKNDVIRETLDQYFETYKFCIETGFNLHTSNKVKLHNATYKEIRRRWPNIPSALVQTIRDVACENLKAVKLKTRPIFKSKFIRYDKRTFRFNKKESVVSLSTVKGRQKIPVKIPEYFKKYLDWNFKAAVVVLKNNQI